MQKKKKKNAILVEIGPETIVDYLNLTEKKKKESVCF